jgi:hypothetical protein
MTILAYFDIPMSTYLSSLFINSLKLIVFVDFLVLTDQKEFVIHVIRKNWVMNFTICLTTFFKDERKKFIPEYLYNVTNTISFSELMNSDDKYVLIITNSF